MCQNNNNGASLDHYEIIMSTPFSLYLNESLYPVTARNISPLLLLLIYGTIFVLNNHMLSQHIYLIVLRGALGNLIQSRFYQITPSLRSAE